MNLLLRSSINYIFFSILSFLIGGIIFYNVIKTVFYRQIDETLKTEKLLIEEQIDFSDSLPDFRQVFNHMIEVTVFNTPNKRFEFIKDTMIYDKSRSTLVPVRQLICENTSIQDKGYIISISKPLAETKQMITKIIGALVLLFAFLTGLLIFVNYIISKSIWVPFNKTLENLRNFDISRDHPLALTETRIHEFRQLNKTLERMTKKMRRDYLNLKEFNENASHEIQTPLSIIKSKLELLIQGEALSEDQMGLINSVYEATTRMSRLNQGLLLISKIDNNQFHDTEQVDLQKIMEKTLEHFEEIIKLKKIRVIPHFTSPAFTQMNPVLSEILISNLVSNSIRHNIEDGEIRITMDSEGFEIANTGHTLTIPTEELFRRFRKSERTMDSVGLGLAIVNKINLLYQFDITYETKEGYHRIRLNVRPGNDAGNANPEEPS
ncbi:MAG: HAMP domain-containing sensor histidine kinase [Bacteroidetes bacterium]|nr:HAMP domain-containing sensor histidine kinase [Bacteroidota bacterium]